MRDMNYYNSIWYRATIPVKRLWFRLLLSRGKLIKVDERHRGIGKTYMMIDKAMKHDIPILAGSQQHIDMIKRSANSVDVYGFAPNFSKHIVSQKFPNGVLIDESVKPEMIEKLSDSNIRIRGGFIQNYNKGDNK